jgi:hypothetical protein
MTTTNVMEFDPAGLFEDVATTASPDAVQVDDGDGGFPKGKVACVLREDICDAEGKVIVARGSGAKPAIKDEVGRVYLVSESGGRVFLNDDQWDEAVELYDSDVDPDAATVLADEDDGPQPGDDLDDDDADIMDEVLGQMVEDDVAEQFEARATSGISQAEDALVEIRNAEGKCIEAEAKVDDLKEQLKEAKAHYDGCVDRLRKLARATTLDAHRPLLAAAEAVNAEEAARIEPAEAATDASDDDGAMIDDEEVAASLTSDAVNEHLALRPGQLRIRLTKDIVDDHPSRGTLTWSKGTVLVANVDSSGTTIIPFADDPTDGTGLEAEEFDVIEDGEFNVVTTPEPSTNDARLDTPLAETSIPSAILAKLKDEARIVTVRDLANWSSSGKLLTDIKGIGQGKADKIDAAMVEFWKS